MYLYYDSIEPDKILRCYTHTMWKFFVFRYIRFNSEENIHIINNKIEKILKIDKILCKTVKIVKVI